MEKQMSDLHKNEFSTFFEQSPYILHCLLHPLSCMQDVRRNNKVILGVMI